MACWPSAGWSAPAPFAAPGSATSTGPRRPTAPPVGAAAAADRSEPTASPPPPSCSPPPAPRPPQRRPLAVTGSARRQVNARTSESAYLNSIAAAWRPADRGERRPTAARTTMGRRSRRSSRASVAPRWRQRSYGDARADQPGRRRREPLDNTVWTCAGPGSRCAAAAVSRSAPDASAMSRVIDHPAAAGRGFGSFIAGDQYGPGSADRRGATGRGSGSFVARGSARPGPV